jgi:hypothetical protein
VTTVDPALEHAWCNAIHVRKAIRKATVSAENYEIVVKGTFGPSIVSALRGFRVDHTDNGLTVLVGSVPDQARLLGVLAALRDLTIPLVSVNPVSPDTPNLPDENGPTSADTTEGHPHG